MVNAAFKNIFLVAGIVISCIGNSIQSHAQEFADPDFYLLDSLVLSDLPEGDRATLKKHLDAYHEETSDTLRLSRLNSIIEELKSSVWEDYNHQMYKDSRSLLRRSDELNQEELDQIRRYLAASLNNKGFAIRRKGNTWMAVDYYMKAIEIYKEVGDRKGIAVCYLNSANAYHTVGEIDLSNEMDIKALEIAEEIEDYAMVSIGYKNLAMKLMMSDFNDEALENAKISLRYARLIPDNPLAEARANLGMGQVYSRLKEDSLASIHFDAAIQSHRIVAANEAFATSLNAYSEFCLDRIVRLDEKGEDFRWLVDSTMAMLNQALSLARKGGLKNTRIRSYTNKSKLYRYQGNTELALVFVDSAWTMTKDSDNLSKKRGTSWTRYQILKEIGRYNDALEMLEIYIEVKQKIDNSASLKISTQHKLKIEHRLKVASDSLERLAEQEIFKKDIQNEKDLVEAGRTQMWFLYGSLLLIATFWFIMYNRFKVTSRQKEVIEGQKQDIEEAHEEITDSINYAKHLQSAIFPSEKLVAQCGSENFIFFKPKDVVSGDFYWMQKRDDKIFVAVADCTGHGVPGAMVSVVCSNALSRTIKEFSLSNPAKILDKARELVIETFSESGEEVKDGMDISLCTLDLGARKVAFAGANNPLWLVRDKEMLDMENVFENGKLGLVEYKGDRQPVGLFESAVPFNQVDIDLNSGDRLYLFTDGYPDQFGGEKGKKLKYKVMKQLLLESGDRDMSRQMEFLSQKFEEWKGSYEQVDDVCIMGIKI